MSREQKIGLPFVLTWLGVSFFVPYFLNLSLWDKVSLSLGLLFLGPPVLGISLMAVYLLLYNLFFRIPHEIGAGITEIIDNRFAGPPHKQTGEVSLQIERSPPPPPPPARLPPARLNCAHPWLAYWDYSKDRCIKCFEISVAKELK